MSAEDIEEFNTALKEITYLAISLESEYDRIRCCEWIRKLNDIRTDSLEGIKLRNDYIQYLKINLRAGILHGIFLKMPPKGDLKPLTEVMANDIINKIPDLPQVGPIAPFMQYRTEDGCAYVSIKKITGKGVFCYMAVSPDGL